MLLHYESYSKSKILKTDIVPEASAATIFLLSDETSIDIYNNY